MHVMCIFIVFITTKSAQLILQPYISQQYLFISCFIFIVLYKRYCCDIYSCNINFAFVGCNKNNAQMCICVYIHTYIHIGRGIEPVHAICLTVVETGTVIVWFMSVCIGGFRRLRQDIYWKMIRCQSILFCNP
jgi:hypothetical protein